MHATYHRDGRQATVHWLNKKYSNDSETRYGDAAKYLGRNAYAISVTSNQGNEPVSAAIVARSPETVVEVAVVLDTSTCKETAVVLSDSRTACRNFQKGN